MKKWIKRLSLILMTVIVMPGLIYLGLAIYYQDSFMYGTWINGIYCTGKTVPEVAEELMDNFTYDTVYVVTPQDVEMLEVDNLEVQYDFESSLEEYRRRQNPFVWYGHILTGHQNETILPKITFNKDLLEEWIYSTNSYKSNLKMEEDSLQIVLGENGYEILEHKEKILNVSMALEKLSEVIQNAGTEIDLEEQECYFSREETLEMQQTRQLYEKIEGIQNISLTYKLKDSEKKVMPSEAALWIGRNQDGSFMLDKKGELVFDKGAVTDFIEKLSTQYDTWLNFPFTTHDGREIVLKKGNYGTKIHQKKEVDYLLNYLKNPGEDVREPVYMKDVTYGDTNRIDTTYVEVDMTIQKMMFFKDKEKVFETEVVTGCTSQGMGTPELVCHVYSKNRNRILQGTNYRSFVNYWVPVYGGIGIHDATWRNKFGGELYKRSGSHGCINTPLEKMKELYDMLEVGMPVVIHY